MMTMDLDEVDRALDMRVVYSLTGNLPVAEFTKRLSLSLQSGLHFGKDRLEISFFIPDELASNREISIFLAQSNATREGNVYFSNFEMTTEDIYNLLTGTIDGSRSCVLDNMYLSNGTYYLSFRFHSSDLHNVTQNVLKTSSKLDGLSVKYLGPNPGIYSVLQDVRKTTALKEIRWQTRVPENAKKLRPFSILPDSWVLESRFMTTGMQVSELVRTRERISNAAENGITELVPGQNLYEFKLDIGDPFLKKFFSHLYESRTIRFSRIFEYENGVLQVRTIIPTVLEENYMASISRIADEFPDWEMSLLQVSDLE